MDTLALIAREQDPQAFVDQLSKLLREDHPAMTTAEIAEHNAKLSLLLTRCDAVKFAGFSLTEVERADLLAKSRLVLTAGQTAARP